MTEQVDKVCDAVAARLRDLLPQVFKDLYAATLRTMQDDHQRALAREAAQLAVRREDGVVIDQLKAELAELATLALDIERALCNARGAASDLSERTDEIASRAFDAERSLRCALRWSSALDEVIASPQSW